MSEGEKPVPVPRPRQLKSTDETDATSSRVYENYTIPGHKSSVYDNLNEQLDELKAEAAVQRPVPTPRARVSAAPKINYENAPRPLNNQDEISPSRKTGAIRKAPSIPSVKNNLDDNTELVMTTSTESRESDVLSQTSSNSNDSKYQTPSPG